MFVKNITDKEIGAFTYEGYEFTIPVGVSAIYTPAGDYLLRTIYKVESTESGTGGVPPLLRARREQWDGKTYTDVRRFKINESQFPGKNDLIKIAKTRGLTADTIQKFEEDDFDNRDIVEVLNQMAVPDEVKIPEQNEEVNDNASRDNKNQE